MSVPSFAKLPGTGDLIDGKYTLGELLGRGGMGAVYAARHIKLGHAVAIKVMLADAANHEAAQRFVNEGRAAANIQNDHVVRVSDVDEENGYAYMVLELLQGDDLAQVLERETRLPAHVAVGYVLQALQGVRQAHAQGIVHRDLKPSNLFLARRQDGAVVVKVLDFGISKANNNSGLGAAPGALTSTKALLGSPLYMSPEQLRSSKNVDARADIWAMGVILFELISGTLPFNGENLGELFAAILETDAPNLQLRQPEAPPGLAAIVARCLERRPEHRFQNVGELARELAPYTSAVSGPAAWPAASSMASTAMPVASAASLRFEQSQPGAGTGPHDSVVKGTVPLGANTPQPYGPPPAAAPLPLPPTQSSPGVHAPVAPQQRSTGNTWQSGQSGQNATAAKGSSAGLVFGLVCGALALEGIALGTVAKLRGQTEERARDEHHGERRHEQRPAQQGMHGRSRQRGSHGRAVRHERHAEHHLQGGDGDGDDRTPRLLAMLEELRSHLGCGAAARQHLLRVRAGS